MSHFTQNIEELLGVLRESPRHIVGALDATGFLINDENVTLCKNSRIYYA